MYITSVGASGEARNNFLLVKSRIQSDTLFRPSERDFFCFLPLISTKIKSENLPF
jgi:hypothetical protein